jgi:glycosyltransferase involved in cell wall biosynthesis
VVAAAVLLQNHDVEHLSTSGLLHELALIAKRSDDLSATWLLHVALVGVFPENEQVSDLRRRLALTGDGGAMLAVLESTIDIASRDISAERTMRLVSDRVLVDVNFCASHDHNTGLQRVVRKSMPFWANGRLPVEFVAWTRDADGYCALDDQQRERVLNWDSWAESEGHRRRDHSKNLRIEQEELLVPWRTTVFLPEVPFDHLCGKLAAMALASGNDVRLIGYDAIPLVSAESQSPAESERFAHYLSIVKHCTMVIGISESASAEFTGFNRALVAQGLDGPIVHTVALAREAALERSQTPHSSGVPMVLCVGSHEPRKNQDAVLYAAEQLHFEGLEFEMVFLGGGSRAAISHFDSRVRRIRKRGFAVQSMRRASDRELFGLYARARFSVFVSLHEGYGLPVVESLGHGTPVLTSNFGSLAEIAQLGGCLEVDPRDDTAIIDGMRRMLTDDRLIGRLSDEAGAIPERSWSQYAAELWSRVSATMPVASS